MSGLPPVSVWRRGFWRQTVFLLGILAFGLGAAKANAEAPRVLPAGKKPNDQRLGEPKNLNGYFPFKPPATQQEWQQRAERVRRQTKVATGLWPEPAKTPVNAVVHGKVDRPEYTVEKVYLESFPGFYVTGNLYRPKGAAASCRACFARTGTGPTAGSMTPAARRRGNRLSKAPSGSKTAAASLCKPAACSWLGWAAWCFITT